VEERRAHPRVAADHWLAGGDAGRARPLFVEAARRSCAVHAYRDAAVAARAALELWPEGEDEPGRLRVLEELGRCAQICGELSEALARGRRLSRASTASPTGSVWQT
jgi:hypothetical protein